MPPEQMTDAIAKLDDATDWSDPNTYAQILGAAVEEDAPPAAAAPAPQGDTAPAPPAAPAVAAPAAHAAPAAEPPKPESSAAPAAAEPPKVEEPPIEGVATKDGKRVIPYAVLQEARQTATHAASRAQQLAAEVQRLTGEMQALKQGQQAAESKAPAVSFSPEELAQMETDFPHMAKLARGYAALQEELLRTKQAVATQPPAAAPAPAANDLQELIDDRPLLARWQAKGGTAWAMAVERDQKLMADPAWAGKTTAERFDEVQRQLADELGIEVPKQQQVQAPPPPPAPAPAPAAPAAPTPPAPPAPLPQPQQAAVPTLSDLGGTAPKSEQDAWASTTMQDALARAHSMSEVELMRLGGVNW